MFRFSVLVFCLILAACDVGAEDFGLRCLSETQNTRFPIGFANKFAIFDAKVTARFMTVIGEHCDESRNSTLHFKILEETDGNIFTVLPHLAADLELEGCIVAEDHFDFDLEETTLQFEDSLLWMQISTDENHDICAHVIGHNILEWGRYRLLYAFGLLVIVYASIGFELLDRTLAASLGALAALFLLTSLHEKPEIEEIAVWIDEATIGLLLGMMIMVGIFSGTGFFEYCAVVAVKKSHGRMWALLLMLCLLSAVFSAFLDNVTTVLLLSPVTIRLANMLNVSHVPLLIAEAVFSNIGGTATMIGDPPNIIIGNLLKRYLTFNDFLINLGPPVLAIAMPALFWVLYYSREEYMQTRKYDLANIQKQFKIKDKVLMIKCAIVLGGVIILFFLHPVIHLDPTYSAMGGAVILLTLSKPKSVEEVLEKVEWDTLVFFSALFIFIEELSELGMIRSIATFTADLIRGVDDSARVPVALLLIIWVSAIASAFIDNIPYTASMVPVILALSKDKELNLELKPLAWALSLGACLGGNGTLVGASANVVVAGISERHGRKLGFLEFFKVGFPIMILTVSLASMYLLAAYT